MIKMQEIPKIDPLDTTDIHVAPFQDINTVANNHLNPKLIPELSNIFSVNQGCSRGRDIRDQDRDRDMGGPDQDRDRGHLN